MLLQPVPGPCVPLREERRGEGRRYSGGPCNGEMTLGQYQHHGVEGHTASMIWMSGMGECMLYYRRNWLLISFLGAMVFMMMGSRHMCFDVQEILIVGVLGGDVALL